MRGALEARISRFSICGGLANSSSALANSALAISPVRCAFLPSSSLNVSKMPNFAGPSLRAYQVVVPVSLTARGCADFRNDSTSCSFPCLRLEHGKQRELVHWGTSGDFPTLVRCSSAAIVTAAGYGKSRAMGCADRTPEAGGSLPALAAVRGARQHFCQLHWLSHAMHALGTRYASCFCAFLSRRGTAVCTLPRWCLPTIRRCCLPTRG